MHHKHQFSRAALELALCGLHQGQIADALGVHQGTVSRWLNGRSPAPQRFADLLERRLGPAAYRVLDAVEGAVRERDEESAVT